MRVVRKMLKAKPDKYEMKHIIKPTIQGGLSSTVIVDGKYYVDISFNFALVQQVGRVLPRGVSPFLPAFLTMDYDVHDQVYRMYVQYLDKARQGEYFDLLIFKERPKWLRFMRPLPGMVEPKQEPKIARTRHGNTPNREAHTA